MLLKLGIWKTILKSYRLNSLDCDTSKEMQGTVKLSADDAMATKNYDRFLFAFRY